MKLPPARTLSEHVTTDVDDARTARLWARVGANMNSSPARKRVRDWRWSAVAIVAAAVAAVAFLISRRTDDRRVQAVEYDKNGAMTLADGSRVRLRDDGRVRVEHVESKSIELTLAQGTAEMDVVHVPSRSFVVHAGHFDIVDVGTRFVVTLEPSGVRVIVDVGRVEVRDTTGELPSRVLGAGESWSSNAVAAPQTTASVDETEAPNPNATTTASTAKPRSAKELLEEADAARVAGHVSDAASLLDNVRRWHRSDPRAGLAAFQLGRLRLDALADAVGAVEAFDDAIALSPSASFREDAEARRVEALERARDPRCREARETYLARYRDGLRAKEVAARCGP
jgi:hypothetical protein